MVGINNSISQSCMLYILLISPNQVIPLEKKGTELWKEGSLKVNSAEMGQLQSCFYSCSGVGDFY